MIKNIFRVKNISYNIVVISVYECLKEKSGKMCFVSWSKMLCFIYKCATLICQVIFMSQIFGFSKGTNILYGNINGNIILWSYEIYIFRGNVFSNKTTKNSLNYYGSDSNIYPPCTWTHYMFEVNTKIIWISNKFLNYSFITIYA